LGYSRARDEYKKTPTTDETRNRSIYERAKLKNMQAMPPRETSHVRRMNKWYKSLKFSDFFVGIGEIANTESIGNVIAKIMIDMCNGVVMLALFIAKN
jgi:hypothetical protein